MEHLKHAYFNAFHAWKLLSYMAKSRNALLHVVVLLEFMLNVYTCYGV